MFTGSKYVPPHLRDSQGGGGPSTTTNDSHVDNRGEPPRAGYGGSSRSGHSSSRGSRAGYGGGGDRSGSYRGNQQLQQQPIHNHQ